MPEEKKKTSLYMFSLVILKFSFVILIHSMIWLKVFSFKINFVSCTNFARLKTNIDEIKQNYDCGQINPLTTKNWPFKYLIYWNNPFYLEKCRTFL